MISNENELRYSTHVQNLVWTFRFKDSNEQRINDEGPSSHRDINSSRITPFKMIDSQPFQYEFIVRTWVTSVLSGADDGLLEQRA